MPVSQVDTPPWTLSREYKVHLRKLHSQQVAFCRSSAKRRIVKAGRRSGKTVGVATLAVERFLAGKRVLYAVPTAEQLGVFWYEVCTALREPIAAEVFAKNETEHFIELRGTQRRIKAKTAWNADTLRGDFADLLILDEWQLCDEDAWGQVGAPMLLDNDGDAVFLYTPPSLRSAGVSKARDPRHASKLFSKARADTMGRWEVFHFTSFDNPYISREALKELTSSDDMSRAAYRLEILAEDSEVPETALVYRQFNFITCVLPGFPIQVSWPRYVGHDFGGANPAAIFLAQDPNTGYFYVYQEYLPGSGVSMVQHVGTFKTLTQGTNVIRRIGGSHQEEEIRQGYTAMGWPIQEPRLSNVGAGIDQVRAIMETNKLFIFQECRNLLEELANYSFKIDANGAVTDEIDSKAKFHLLDALRYVASDFKLEIL